MSINRTKLDKSAGKKNLAMVWPAIPVPVPTYNFKSASLVLSHPQIYRCTLATHGIAREVGSKFHSETIPLSKSYLCRNGISMWNFAIINRIIPTCQKNVHVFLMHWYTCKSLLNTLLRKSCRTVGWVPCQASKSQQSRSKYNSHACQPRREVVLWRSRP